MLPKINNTLILQVASYDEAEAKQEYKSRIADMDDQHLFIEVPIHEQSGRLKRLVQGDQLSAYYVFDGGVKHYFHSEVLGTKEDVIRLYIIRKPDPESITRVQRRNFLRVPANLEVAAKLKDHLQFIGMTDDVGGGGISIICDGHVPIQQGDKLDCWLLIPYRNGSIDHSHFMAEVVRIKMLETGKQLAMCRYAEISEPEQQRIIRFCFERQLDFRKK